MSLWTVAFKMIANANDLIQHIEQTDAHLFEKGEMEKKMIFALDILIFPELLAKTPAAVVSKSATRLLACMSCFDAF